MERNGSGMVKRRPRTLQSKNKNKNNNKNFANEREEKNTKTTTAKLKSCVSDSENSTLTLPLDNLWWVEVSNHLDNKGYHNFILTCSTFYRICKNRTEWFKTKFSKRIETIHGLRIETISNNTESIYYILPNGNFHGPFKSWFENGKLRMERTYKDGKLNGIYRIYYDNGKPYLETTYKDGKLNGLHRIFYDNGNIHTEITYEDGKSNGIHRMWHENGNEKFAFSKKISLDKLFFFVGKIY